MNRPEPSRSDPVSHLVERGFREVAPGFLAGGGFLVDSRGDVPTLLCPLSPEHDPATFVAFRRDVRGLRNGPDVDLLTALSASDPTSEGLWSTPDHKQHFLTPKASFSPKPVSAQPPGTPLSDQLLGCGARLAAQSGSTQIYSIDTPTLRCVITLNDGRCAGVFSPHDQLSRRPPQLRAPFTIEGCVEHLWGLRALTGASTAVVLSNGWSTFEVGTDLRVATSEILREPTDAELGLHRREGSSDMAALVGDAHDQADAIRGLTHINGQPVHAIEAALREPAFPQLGPRASLLSTIIRDNEVVRRAKLEHYELAQPLLRLRSLVRHSVLPWEGGRVTDSGTSFELREEGLQRPPVPSPFGDRSSMTGLLFVSPEGQQHWRVPNNRADQIARYWFYGGIGTWSRLAPEQIIAAIPSLRSRAPDLAKIVADVDAGRPARSTLKPPTARRLGL